ncbi:MAG: hypothetical protein VB089_11695 [Anaerolineaceae bacterium]|nr:hypothetical protein [Anaerolineaceae bacterium]
MGIDGGDVRDEENSMHPPGAKKTPKTWIWIIVIVLLVLSCCVAIIGGGLVYLFNQDLGWQDVLPSGWEEPPVAPHVSIHSPVPLGAVQLIPQVETAVLQNDFPAEAMKTINFSQQVHPNSVQEPWWWKYPGKQLNFVQIFYGLKQSTCKTYI